MSATFQVHTESQFGDDWIGFRPSSKMPSWVSHKWVETVTCYSARTSSSTFTALLAPQDFSLSSNPLNDFKMCFGVLGNLCPIDFEKLF